MPGHAGSPYWAAVDFDSEGDDDQTPPSNQRVYFDPWDNGIQVETAESSQGDNFNSFVGEPVSASFYYVPTKNYESDDEIPHRRNIAAEEILSPDYPIYGRKLSRTMPAYYHPEVVVYERPINRKRSLYIEEPIYATHSPLIYEPLYGVMPPPPSPLPGYGPGMRRSLSAMHHHPDYLMANVGYSKPRRHSRLTDAYEHFAYETLSPEYEDWARPLPKTAPDNFHLSRYGHLQIDYSCSWNSLDRLIRHS